MLPLFLHQNLHTLDSLKPPAFFPFVVLRTCILLPAVGLSPTRNTSLENCKKDVLWQLLCKYLFNS